jgi:hypothetical protein
MPTFTPEDRETIRAQVQAQITDIESAVSLEDVERNKTYAAGYVDAMVAAWNAKTRPHVTHNELNRNPFMSTEGSVGRVTMVRLLSQST